MTNHQLAGLILGASACCATLAILIVIVTLWERFR